MQDLTAEEFYHVLKLRIDTFVVEQHRIYHELDANDPKAIHVFFQDDENQEAQAYARIFEQGDHVTFGRVVTSKAVRGQGMGGKLLEQILAVCEKNWPGKEIKIEAQSQVVGYYEKYGFSTVGEQFILEGTPHIEMVKK
ncbi:GNAT family (ElaA) [Eupransor demetentiae]|uniref:GNAT family (ElaA) n=2 Tax=Eupransor demetentiae TaxID=3109584 RepID=A0ABP0ESS1_9LACO|nr:GNAT family (ElaA) [Lactobacillaceae bacterium LMG 33000]